MSARLLSPIRVLLPEDNEDDFWLVQAAVARGNFPIEIYRVFDFAEAWDYLNGEGRFRDRALYPFPDVVVSDLYLRGESGLDLLDRMQTNPRFESIPVWLLSGSRRKTDATAALHAGAKGFITKPSAMGKWREVMARLCQEIGTVFMSPATENIPVHRRPQAG